MIKNEALSPVGWLTTPCRSLGLIFSFVCGEGNELFITELILNFLVFWVEGVYVTHFSASEWPGVISTLLIL